MTTTALVILIVFAAAYAIAAAALAWNYNALRKRANRVIWQLYTHPNGKRYWKPTKKQPKPKDYGR